MPPILTPAGPGLGAPWLRLAERIRAEITVTEIDGIWVFRVLRRDGRDFGTAVVSRVDGNRRRIYTAQFVHTVKGKTRGRFDTEIALAGTGPLEALEELLGLVPKRSADEEPPVPVAVEAWFPPLSEEAEASDAGAGPDPDVDADEEGQPDAG
jgi:hypothetical protein